MNDETEVFVILGLGNSDKPRAATFDRSEAELAARAARTLGLMLARAETDEAKTLAKQLPQGKLYSTGKSLLPLVRRETYDRLLKVVTIVEPPAANTPPTTYQNPWDSIEVGGTVLAHASRDEGWFEAVVTEVSKDKKLLTLKWIGYPKLPAFKSKRIAVALVAKL